LPGAHGLLGASLRLDASLLDLAPQLEAVSSVSVGVDNYDIDELSRRGILLSNTPDVLTETTADTGFALILATARRVVELANWVRDGQWQPTSARRILAVMCTARRWASSAWAASARPWPGAHFGFGMRVLYHSQRAKPEVEHAMRTQCSLDACCSRRISSA
jgi:phosphogluconate 2-dehydrogenase